MGTFPTTRRNLGKNKNSVNMGLIKGIIVTPDSFSLSSVNKLLKAQWQSALFDTPSNRVHLLPRFREFTDQSEKTIYDSTDLSKMFVRNGRREFNIRVKENFFIHQALQTYSGAVAKVIIIDSNNYFWGVTDAAGTFSGYTVELFQAESMMLNDGKKSTSSPITVSLSDSTEMDVLGGYVNAQAFFPSLKELVDVDVAQSGVIAGTTLKLTVNVTADGSSVDNLANVAPDFLVKSATGVARVITAMAQDATTGVYTLTVTALVAGDIANLNVPSVLSVPGYESTGSIVTV